MDQGSGFLCLALERLRKGIFMLKWSDLLRRFLIEEDGPTAVEYAVMLALIIVVCIAAITTLGSNANKAFSNVALNAAAGSSSSSS
jgi:pilus assembly protein Flp/PilA